MKTVTILRLTLSRKLAPKGTVHLKGCLTAGPRIYTGKKNIADQLASELPGHEVTGNAFWSIGTAEFAGYYIGGQTELSIPVSYSYPAAPAGPLILPLVVPISNVNYNRLRLSGYMKRIRKTASAGALIALFILLAVIRCMIIGSCEPIFIGMFLSGFVLFKNPNRWLQVTAVIMMTSATLGLLHDLIWRVKYGA